MCGIGGSYSHDASISNSISNILFHSLYRRGPDSGDVMSINGFSFVHRRLAIQDLSLSGSQPMYSFCGRYIITFNGEIYNHFEIRDYIKRRGFFIDWHGNSDTETLVNSISVLGLVKTLSLCEGMFSFCFFDIREDTLTLVRDRVGEKPLYYGFINFNSQKVFCFSSDLSFISKELLSNLSLNSVSISKYLYFNYLPDHESVFKEFHQVRPGSFVTFSATQMSVSEHLYWEWPHRFDNKFSNFQKSSFDLENLIESTVAKTLIGDVPVGLFLSGGVDSSLIGIMASYVSKSHIKSYSIGLNNSFLDENSSAELLAKRLGFEHRKIQFTPDDVKYYFEKLVSCYSEPHADISSLPTLKLSDYASKEVKVVLTGDGGDELFCGYNRHIFFRLYLDYGFNYFPDLFFSPFRSFLESQFSSISVSNFLLRRQVRRFYQILSSFEIVKSFGAIGLLAESSMIENIKFDSSSSLWFDQRRGDTLEDLINFDAIHFLPYSVLRKVDRAAMYYSLESRAPFLNHNIIEFSSHLPKDFLLKGVKGKVILRDILKRYKNLYANANAQKQGFEIPLSDWMRGPLHLWVDQKVEQMGYIYNFIEKKDFQKMLISQRKGNDILTQGIWNVLVLSEWFNSKNY